MGLLVTTPTSETYVSKRTVRQIARCKKCKRLRTMSTKRSDAPWALPAFIADMRAPDFTGVEPTTTGETRGAIAEPAPAPAASVSRVWIVFCGMHYEYYDAVGVFESLGLAHRAAEQLMTKAQGKWTRETTSDPRRVAHWNGCESSCDTFTIEVWDVQHAASDAGNEEVKHV